MSLWTSAEAAAATGGRSAGEWIADGISIDTRTLQPGDLFVALTAARDGHDFVAQALDKGAAAALVSRVPEGVAPDAPLLVVDDVQIGLEALGHAARARTGAKVAAITGSVGKTSTKEMLRDILTGQGRTHVAEASYNNHWGVPLTLARMPRDTEFAVIEIGMNHPGEISPLARMVQPDVAMITTVAAAHLAAFDSVEAIAREKAAILDGLKPGGVAVLNADLDVTPILTAKAAEVGATTVLFGESAQAYHLDGIAVTGNTTVVRAHVRGEALFFRIQTAGQHFAMNALGALAVAEALGADLAVAAADLGNWLPYKGRGAREDILLDPVDTQLKLTLLDDAYNANPTSLGAALDVLAAAEVTDGIGRVAKGRRIAFLGDMKELGRDEIALHRAIVDHPAMAKVHLVHAIGPLMRHMYAALPVEKRGLWFATSQEMVPHVRALIDAGDVVLAKGSLSMQLARIVDAVRKLGHAAPQTDERAELAPQKGNR